MTLASRTQLGPYEIQSPLGAGGMGEVYRARDTRLGRDVAIKVLPAAFSRDPERLRRFKQEAQVVAALNHPNILAIHDFGEHEGSPYIVTELLEGQTLRGWLGGSAIPSRKATDAAAQVARGLASAHDKGIVHRDLKPENIFVTRDGRVKILDFGLAKLTPEPTPDAATVPSRTEPGVVMGTIGYMSPEQVRGVGADHRSDLFSLGTVLYEMLSGKRAFHGETSVDAASAILHSEPQDLTEMDKGVSPALSRIVGHCLEKSPEARFQSAHDLVFDLEAVSETSASHSVTPLSRSRRLSRMGIGIVVALVILAGLAALVVLVARQRLARVRVPVLHQITFRRGTVWNARFAPDGKSVIYGAAWEGNPVEIFHSSLDSPDARPLGLIGADVLSILPNGEMAVVLRRQRDVGFSFKGMLARVPVAGGAPREILDRVESADGAPDGSLAVAYHSQGKARLEFPIGTLRFESSTWIGDVRVSPKGDMVAFVEHDDPVSDNGVVRVVGPKGSQKLTRDYSSVQGLAWSVAGDKIWYTAADSGGTARNLHVVDLYGHDRLVYRVPGTLRVQDVAKDGRILLVHEASRAGILAHVPGSSGERELGWLDWSIVRSLSDNGKRLMFDESGDAPGDQVWIYLRETDGSPPLRLGQGAYGDLSPDGKWVAVVPSDFSNHIHIIPTGAGQERVLDVQDKKPFSVSWVPNEKQLLLRAAAPGEAQRGYVFDLDTAALRPITPEGVRLTGPSSPDGKFVAGTRADGTTWLFPIGGGSPRPIALHALEAVASWSSDSKAVYVDSTGETAVNVYRIEIDTGKRTPFTILSPSDKAGLTYLALCCVTPDGKFYAYSYNRQISELFIVGGLE
jgi:eukaryotic-like serine/threonine-protein kinase